MYTTGRMEGAEIQLHEMLLLGRLDSNIESKSYILESFDDVK